MTRQLSTLLALIGIAAGTGCLRELEGASCPCLEGWVCCEAQNLCKPEGETCDPSDGSGGSSDGDLDAGDSRGDAAPADVCEGSQQPATRVCPGGPFAFAHLDSGKATASALVGRWQVCDGTGFRWGAESARAGIEFTSDGKFFLLGRDAQGALQRVVGLRTSGAYKLGADDDVNVSFTFPEGGAAYFYPSFDAQQAHLFAGGDSGFDSSYVRVPPGADNVPGVVVPGACESVSDGGLLDGSAMCDTPAAPFCPGGPFAFAALTSQSETLQALVGRWQVCEGTGFRWGPESAHRGIEFTSDGKFFLLGVDAQGALQRPAGGVRSSGSYSMSEDPLFKDVTVYFQFPEGGGALFDPSFDAEQAHLFTGYDGFDSSYVRVPSGADNVPGVVAPACESVSDGGVLDGSVLDGSAMCDAAAAPFCPGGPFAFAALTSQTETLQALVGRWQVCEGTGFRWGPESAHRGIEFTSDGKFFLLGVDAQGALQRPVGGVYSRGSYSMSEDPLFKDLHVYFQFPEGGGAAFYPSFDAQQAHLFTGYDGFDSSYVRVPSGADNVPGVLSPGICH